MFNYTIFINRADSGLLKEDSSPMMPASEVLSKVIQKN